MFLGSKRINKRHMKLLRGSERDLKLDIASAQSTTIEHVTCEEDCNYPKTPGYQVECSQPFLSLMCRTLPCHKTNKNGENKISVYESAEKSDTENGDDGVAEECSYSRLEFYHTLKALIRMGSGERHLDRHARRAVSSSTYSK